MSEVIKFPQRLCSQCDQKATENIRLIDGDDGSDAGKKYFCEEHFPQVTEHE